MFSRIATTTVCKLDINCSCLSAVRIITASNDEGGTVIIQRHDNETRHVFHNIELAALRSAILSYTTVVPFPSTLTITSSTMSSHLAYREGLEGTTIREQKCHKVEGNHEIITYVSNHTRDNNRSVIHNVLVRLNCLVGSVRIPIADVSTTENPLQLSVLLRTSSNSLISLRISKNRGCRGPRVGNNSPLRTLVHRERHRTKVATHNCGIIHIAITRTESHT